MATPAPRSFQKRVRLTKLQELQIGKHRHDQPSATLAELATWTQAEILAGYKAFKAAGCSRPAVRAQTRPSFH
ncbi:hypothetical protein PF011_g6735 [Phytophthora fragariae]|uniref:Uncharacterized protein n=1 Tax=Phytophthora fragariae TaxID=53985 RepID=A0A6A3LE70_9STRA|nr:hypothetical protein PF011_g6735 [Phytophthora fragariae]